MLREVLNLLSEQTNALLESLLELRLAHLGRLIHLSDLLLETGDLNC